MYVVTPNTIAESLPSREITAFGHMSIMYFSRGRRRECRYTFTRLPIKAMQQTYHTILHLLHKMNEDARAKNVQYGSNMEKGAMHQKC